MPNAILHSLQIISSYITNYLVQRTLEYVQNICNAMVIFFLAYHNPRTISHDFNFDFDFTCLTIEDLIKGYQSFSYFHLHL